MGYVLTGGLGGSVLFIYGACLPAIAMNRYGLSPQQLSWVLALGAGGMMAFAQFNRFLLRRYHRDQILKTANLAQRHSWRAAVRGRMVRQGRFCGPDRAHAVDPGPARTEPAARGRGRPRL